MANRKTGTVAAPVKQRLRKNHGPKRHLFKEYKPLVWQFAKDGLLNKYNNEESFALACGARGVRTNIHYLWEEFKFLPHDKQNEYLKNLSANAERIASQTVSKIKKHTK